MLVLTSTKIKIRSRKVVSVVKRRSLAHRSTTWERAAPPFRASKPEVPEFFLGLDRLNLPPSEAYSLIRGYYGPDGAYEQEPDARYRHLLCERVLHRNTPEGDDRSYRLLVRASDEALSLTKSSYTTSVNSDHSYMQRGRNPADIQDKKINHYDPNQLMVIITDGRRVMDVRVDSLMGSSHWRTLRQGLGEEDIIASLTIDGKEWRRLELSRDFQTGIVNLPDGRPGWVLNKEESQIEIAVSMPETMEPSRSDRALGHVATKAIQELVGA